MTEKKSILDWKYNGGLNKPESSISTYNYQPPLAKKY
jgi:hypothetical protein